MLSMMPPVKPSLRWPGASSSVAAAIRNFSTATVLRRAGGSRRYKAHPRLKQACVVDWEKLETQVENGTATPKTLRLLQCCCCAGLGERGNVAMRCHSPTRAPNCRFPLAFDAGLTWRPLLPGSTEGIQYIQYVHTYISCVSWVVVAAGCTSTPISIPQSPPLPCSPLRPALPLADSN